jgi:hypothetical protein
MNHDPRRKVRGTREIELQRSQVEPAFIRVSVVAFKTMRTQEWLDPLHCTNRRLIGE